MLVALEVPASDRNAAHLLRHAPARAQSAGAYDQIFATLKRCELADAVK